MRNRFPAVLTLIVLLAGLGWGNGVFAETTAPAGPGGSKAVVFNAEEAFDLLKAQVELGPRNPGSKGHAACLEWMRRLLEESGARVELHPFTVKDPYGKGMLHLTNLRASFLPDAKRRVALAAHWDTRPRADRQPGGAVDQPIPGANDGASGVAVLLQIARMLGRHRPAELGVDLLFFDGEDYGREGDTGYYLLGSRRFVHDFPSYRPQALILVDMVGGRDLTIPMEGNSLRYANDLTLTIFSRAAQMGLPAFTAEPGPTLLDDHVPFLSMGIPACDLIDFDYPQWHTLQDDVPACSPKSLGQLGSLLWALLQEDFAR